jgi:murein DD-endopeptidase MepM/ murein hydrolase activator NlpD
MNYFGFPLSNPFRSQTPKNFYDAVKGHSGADFIMPVGTPLSLPIKLKVEEILLQKEMGLTIYLSDKKGSIHVFAHNSKIPVKLGDELLPNTVFALSGNSGAKSTNPHSHWEAICKKPTPGLEFMTRDLGGFEGFNVDPIEYMNQFTETHWSDESMAWAIQHKIISFKRDPETPVKWGEFVTALHKTAEKVHEWVTPEEI